MSVIIELSDDEIIALGAIVSKLNLPIFIPKNTPKKLSKTELGLQNLREYRARKKRNK